MKQYTSPAEYEKAMPYLVIWTDGNGNICQDAFKTKKAAEEAAYKLTNARVTTRAKLKKENK